MAEDMGIRSYSRGVLIAAALLAMVAIGASIWRTTHPIAAVTAGEASVDARLSDEIAALEGRTKASPADAQGWMALGGAYFGARRFADSASAYRRATTLTPDDGQAWSALGEVLMTAAPGGVPAEARQAFMTALAKDPKDPRARYFLGVAKDIAGDHRGAIDDWIALLKDTPPGAPWEATVRDMIGTVAARNKIDIADRLAGSGTAAQVPDQASAQSPMINAMVEKLAAKLAANPADVDGWIMLMRSRTALGEVDKARAALATAIAANPSDTVRLKAAAREFGITG